MSEKVRYYCDDSHSGFAYYSDEFELSSNYDDSSENSEEDENHIKFTFSYGNLEDIKELESYIESTYTDENELFNLAFKYERTDYIKYLITEKWNYRRVTNDIFKTILQKGYVDIVKMLVESEAKVAEEKISEALKDSCRNGHPNLVKYLHPLVKDFDSIAFECFNIACSSRNIDTLVYLLYEGVDIDYKTSQHLNVISSVDDRDCLKYVLENVSEEKKKKIKFNMATGKIKDVINDFQKGDIKKDLTTCLSIKKYLSSIK